MTWEKINKFNGKSIPLKKLYAAGDKEDMLRALTSILFLAYENSETLGQMMTQAQNEYIIDVPYDFFTVEEFILLGDPSLKIGGYP